MSAIAKDASITLITAVPGSGKTLRVVWYIREAIKAGEQVFVCNVNGLSSEGEFAGWIPFDDPSRWEALPAGCVLVVDEAQQFFRAASGTVPSYIAAMETIRHRGIRLILITQHPMLLHSNIRALVGRHEHLVRENGKASAIVYRRNSVIDNVRSDAALRKEDFASWSYPTDLYGSYKSAEVHTVKRVITSRAKKVALMIFITVALIALIVYRISTKAHAAAENVAKETDAFALLNPSSHGRKVSPKTAAEYAQHFTPTIPSMPWSMPATMDREIVVQPKIYCMSSELFCNCLTEQGTRYHLPDAECRDIARYGPPYNPFEDERDHVSKRQAIGHEDASRTHRRQVAVFPSDSVAGSSALGYGQVATYGDHGLAPPGTNSIGGE